MEVEWPKLMAFAGSDLANFLLNEKKANFTQQQTLFMQCQQFRSQEMNRHECTKKFIFLLNESVKLLHKSEPSIEQRERVQQL